MAAVPTPTAAPTNTKRTTTSSTTASTTALPAAKPTTKNHSLATIADRAQLLGPHTITIDAHTVLHPYAKLNAASSNITLGAHCIVAEKAVLGSSVGDCSVSDGVSIEAAALVQGERVGEWSSIGAGATIGRGAVVGRWCRVGPLCEVREGEVLEDFTVVFGHGEWRVDAALRDREEVREARMKGRRKECELLAGLIVDAGAKWRG